MNTFVLGAKKGYFNLHKVLLYIRGLEQYLVAAKDVAKHRNTRDNKKRGSHARGVYPTQDISRMGTARVKQEEKADTRVINSKLI